MRRRAVRGQSLPMEPHAVPGRWPFRVGRVTSESNAAAQPASATWTVIPRSRRLALLQSRDNRVPRKGAGVMAEFDELPDSSFAFPRERKEPLMDARHVRNAIARFDQVEGVSNQERDEAWSRIVDAAARFDVEVSESSWREIFRRNGREIPRA
jgi:hypothetical protein